MKAMVLNRLCKIEENSAPLQLQNLPDPVPTAGGVVVRVHANGLCRSDWLICGLCFGH